MRHKEPVIYEDAHIIEDRKKHLHHLGQPSDCRCEPTCEYIEKSADGYVWRRVIRHGRLS